MFIKFDSYGNTVIWRKLMKARWSRKNTATYQGLKYIYLINLVLYLSSQYCQIILYMKLQYLEWMTIDGFVLRACETSLGLELFVSSFSQNHLFYREHCNLDLYRKIDCHQWKIFITTWLDLVLLAREAQTRNW